MDYSTDEIELTKERLKSMPELLDNSNDEGSKWGVEVNDRIVYESDSKRKARNWAKKNIKEGKYEIVGIANLDENLFF